jgi:CO/xanthine dehydrogenase FAD-binding subunit
LVIGAATSMTQLLENPVICRHLPVLSQALRVLGSPLIRHAATLGGNICTASPAGDTLPPLFVLDAVLELRSARCVRQVPIAEFIRGPGKTILEPGEILAAVEVPKPSAFNRHHFEKVGRRKALACSVASLAALLAVSDEGLVETVRLAWGSVGPTVVTSPQVEGILTGKRLEAASLQEAAKAAEAAVSPIDDLRAGAAYRRRVAGNLLFRFLDGRMGDPTAPGVSS